MLHSKCFVELSCAEPKKLRIPGAFHLMHSCKHVEFQDCYCGSLAVADDPVMRLESQKKRKLPRLRAGEELPNDLAGGNLTYTGQAFLELFTHGHCKYAQSSSTHVVMT